MIVMRNYPRLPLLNLTFIIYGNDLGCLFFNLTMLNGLQKIHWSQILQTMRGTFSKSFKINFHTLLVVFL